MSDYPVTVRELRRMWKPHKERLQQLDAEQTANIRFHRACSWLQRAECLEQDDYDLALMSLWVAFNSLYGQWNDEHREPVGDQCCYRNFMDRVLALDQDQQLAGSLRENKRLVMSIYDDEFLSRYFWEEPTTRRARSSKKTKFDARTWYLEGNWTLILDRLLERIYLLRCQLVHGAATYNSSLNRTTIRRCSMMMNHLLRAVLLVWIHHGADENWGSLCYPPLRSNMGI